MSEVFCGAEAEWIRCTRLSRADVHGRSVLVPGSVKVCVFMESLAEVQNFAVIVAVARARLILDCTHDENGNHVKAFRAQALDCDRVINKCGGKKAWRESTQPNHDTVLLASYSQENMSTAMRLIHLKPLETDLPVHQPALSSSQVADRYPRPLPAQPHPPSSS